MIQDLSPNLPHKVSFLVYINGVEVPANEVTVSYGVWEPPAATIVVAPDKELQRLGREDRVQTAIFYLDEFYDPRDKQFRLLFEGEIVGWGYTTTGQGRNITFSAHSHMMVLTQLFPFFMTDVDQFVAGKMGTLDDATVLPQSLLFPAALFFEGLNSVDQKPIKRPFDLIENLFRAFYAAPRRLQADGTPDPSDKFNAATYNSSVAHNFMARWSRMTNFHNRWIPCPLLETTDTRDNTITNGVFPILRAVQSEEAMRAVIEFGNRMGDGNSYFAFLQMIMARMYYEFTMIPNPAIAQVALDGGDVLGPPVFADIDDERGAGPRDPKKPNRLLNFITKPQLTFCIPPMCNTIFGSMISSYSFNEDFATEPTRVYVEDHTSQFFLENKDNQSTHSFVSNATTAAFPPRAQRALDQRFKDQNVTGHNYLIWPEEFFKGPVVKRNEVPSWFYYIRQQYSDEKNFFADKLLQETALYQRYTAYEYYRERSISKVGSVEMGFNPYVVAGFPGVVLDNEDTGMHIYASFMKVSHVLGQSQAMTTVGYANATVFDDFFENYAEELGGLEKSSAVSDQKRLDVVNKRMEELQKKLANASGNDRDRLLQEYESVYKEQQFLSVYTAESAQVRMAPQHPLPDVRNRFQIPKNAAEAYSHMFYQNSTRPGKKVIFNWEDAVGVAASGETVEPITFAVNGVTGSKIVTSRALPDTATGRSPQYRLRNEYATFQNHFDAAMHAVARPLCTLEEYIDFYGDRGVRVTPIDPSHPTQGKGALYYVRILEYRKGPGAEPEEDEHGNRNGPVTADTRSDWTSRLIRYRNKVVTGLNPHKF